MTAWCSWGDVFTHHLDVKGYDHAYAAYRADIWLRRRSARTKKHAKVRHASTDENTDTIITMGTFVAAPARTKKTHEKKGSL